MKGFIATALALVPDFQALRLGADPPRVQLRRGGRLQGVPSLLDHLGARLPPPFGCVVGEPTGMRVANGHKGKAGYVCTVTGLASHSALNHLGVNAIEIAAADRQRAAAPERRVSGRGSIRARLRAAPLHGEHGRHRRRQRAQHRARAVPLRIRVSAAARPAPGRPVRGYPRLGGTDAAAGHARRVSRRRHRMAGADELPRARRHDRRHHRGGLLPAHGHRTTDQAGVWNRGRPLRDPRHSDRGVRPWRDQSGAPAGRVRRAVAAGGLRGSCISWCRRRWRPERCWRGWSKSRRRISARTATATPAFLA